MKRLQLTITEDTYETIRLSAKSEKRSVTNYLDILLNSLFHNDVIVKSDGTSINPSVKTQIKLNDELLKSSKSARELRLDREVEEVNQYGKILTDEEKVYFEKNPDHDIIDFNSRNDDIRKKEQDHLNNNEDRSF